MLDPHRILAVGTRPGELRVEPQVDARLAPDVAPGTVPAGEDEERQLRALRARLRRLPVERAPASLRARVRALLRPRA